jgi:hypothetical protein
MLRIVLPFSALLATIDVSSIGPAIDVIDVILVEVVLVVDGDVTVAPIAITPIVCPGCSQDDSCSKCQPHPGHITWIVIGGIRINPGVTVDYLRIIRRHKGVLRIGRLNYNSLLASLHGFSFHFLLLGCLQRSLALRLCPHALHRVHYVLRLRQKRISQICCPGDICRQPSDHSWEYGHRLDTRIPGLSCHFVGEGVILQVGIALQPLFKLDDLQRVS